jgi:hypothetical protein
VALLCSFLGLQVQLLVVRVHGQPCWLIAGETLKMVSKNNNQIIRIIKCNSPRFVSLCSPLTSTSCLGLLYPFLYPFLACSLFYIFLYFFSTWLQSLVFPKVAYWPS